MLKTFTLKNGLKVASYRIPQMRSAFINLGVKGGYIFDHPQTSGAAHFMEHILVQAIPSFPNVEALSDFIEGLAGSYNASTHPQSIHFHASIPAGHLTDILKIASEVFYQPLFLDLDIERERGAVLEEIRSKQDQTWYKNWRFWADTRYKKGHPMLMFGGGSLEAVEKLKKDDLISYWQQFFHPRNSYLVVVGGFNQKDLKKALEDFFEANKSSVAFPGFPKISNQDLSSRTIAIRQDSDLKACYFELSFPSLHDNAPIEDRVAQSVIAYILGGLRSSRLFRLLRQRRGLVYHVSFSNSSYESFGYCEVELEVAPDKLDETARLVAAELKSFLDQGPTKEEVEFVKNFYSNRVLMNFDHPGAIGGWIQSDLMWGDKIYTPEEYVEIIKGVSQKKIMDLMKREWDFAKLNLVLQGPISDSKENKEKFSEICQTLSNK